MAEAKYIDDSLDFLRYFEKYTENPDLATLIREKLSIDKKSLGLLGCHLNEEDFKAIPALLAERASLEQDGPSEQQLSMF